MTAIKEILPGAYVVENVAVNDRRGSFCKKYTKNLLDDLSIDFIAYEEFYTKSRKGVIRGMHFTMPPFDQAKIISCVFGMVNDVVLDLRKGPNYGEYAEIILNADSPSLLILPSGIAHGFESLSDDSLVTYTTDKAYVANLDCGISYRSFGYEWRTKDPILSSRDLELISFSDFISPFHGKK